MSQFCNRPCGIHGLSRMQPDSLSMTSWSHAAKSHAHLASGDINRLQLVRSFLSLHNYVHTPQRGVRKVVAFCVHSAAAVPSLRASFRLQTPLLSAQRGGSAHSHILLKPNPANIELNIRLSPTTTARHWMSDATTTRA